LKSVPLTLEDGVEVGEVLLTASLLAAALEAVGAAAVALVEGVA
jgi:hypothetical protein